VIFCLGKEAVGVQNSDWGTWPGAVLASQIWRLVEAGVSNGGAVTEKFLSVICTNVQFLTCNQHKSLNFHPRGSITFTKKFHLGSWGMTFDCGGGAVCPPCPYKNRTWAWPTLPFIGTTLANVEHSHLTIALHVLQTGLLFDMYLIINLSLHIAHILSNIAKSKPLKRF